MKKDKLPWVLTGSAVTAFQGHDRLAAHLKAEGALIAGWQGSFKQKLISKMLRRLPGHRASSPSSAYTITQTNLLSRTHAIHSRMIHVLWGDGIIPALKDFRRVIATVHQPVELWDEGFIKAVGNCAGAICMSEREVAELAKKHPNLPATFIPHGIETTFWHPAEAPASKNITIVGRYMRNYEMILRIAESILARDASVTFRWLVNPDFVLPAQIASRLPSNRFQLVRNLSAHELRDLYRKSTLVFIPYDNVTASNAIVEAMSCACPVFTTAVGGMSSYAGDGAMTLVQNNDDEAMLAAIEACLASPERRSQLAAAARNHAIQIPDWKHVTNRHKTFYSAVEANSPAAANP